MLTRRQAINSQLNQLFDSVLLFVVFWLAHALRYYGTFYFGFSPRIAPFAEFFWLGILFAIFGPLFLDFQGFYQSTVSKSLPRQISQVVRAAVWLFVLLGGCVIFFKWSVPSRTVLILFAIFGPLAVIVRDRLFSWRILRRAARSEKLERVILVGIPEDVEALRNSFTPEIHAEMEIVEEFDVETRRIDELVELLHVHSVSRVIFTGGRTHMDRVQLGIEACEVEGVQAWLVADFIKTSIAKPDFDEIGGRPMLVFRATPDISWSFLLKDLIDRTGAFVGLILLSPLMLITALVIRITSPGPVFFKQMRGGRHGKAFQMWKFRSMHTDAEMRRAELETYNQMSGPVFKIENDPRITKFGQFIRKSSIDELPQLFNVLAGDMSLVGPRPLPVYEVEKFESTAQRRRLSVKPGLTCLWQISGRNRVTNFEEWVELDLRYIDNWSIWLDLKILLLTVPVVLFGYGAK